MFGRFVWLFVSVGSFVHPFGFQIEVFRREEIELCILHLITDEHLCAMGIKLGSRLKLRQALGHCAARHWATARHGTGPLGIQGTGTCHSKRSSTPRARSMRAADRCALQTTANMRRAADNMRRAASTRAADWRQLLADARPPAGAASVDHTSAFALRAGCAGSAGDRVVRSFVCLLACLLACLLQAADFDDGALPTISTTVGGTAILEAGRSVWSSQPWRSRELSPGADVGRGEPRLGAG